MKQKTIEGIQDALWALYSVFTPEGTGPESVTTIEELQTYCERNADVTRKLIDNWRKDFDRMTDSRNEALAKQRQLQAEINRLNAVIDEARNALTPSEVTSREDAPEIDNERADRIARAHPYHPITAIKVYRDERGANEGIMPSLAECRDNIYAAYERTGTPRHL